MTNMFGKIKYIHRAFRYRRSVDPAEIEYLILNLKKGATAVDIGCHKGAYLYWMKKSVGETGRVFAFEPQASLYDYLKKIYSGHQNIIIEKKGVSNLRGDAFFHIPGKNKTTSPGARIDSLTTDEEFTKTKIETTTLDDYFFEKNIFPDFIKIDVEGHEKKVLEGGFGILKKSHPKILMECENRHLNEGDIHGIFEWLFSLGYQGYFFFDKTKTDLKKFDLKKHQKTGNGEFWKGEGYVNNFIFE